MIKIPWRLWVYPVIAFLLIGLGMWIGTPKTHKEVKVDVNSQTKHDVNLTQTSTCKVSGSTPLNSLPTTNPITGQKINDSTANLDFTTQVHGDVLLQYIDNETKKILGQGNYPITGTTRVYTQDGQVKTETNFTGQTQIGIDVPKPKEKPWTVEGFTGTNFNRVYLGGSVEYDHKLFSIGDNADAYIFGRFTGDKSLTLKDYDIRIDAGFKIRF